MKNTLALLFCAALLPVAAEGLTALEASRGSAERNFSQSSALATYLLENAGQEAPPESVLQDPKPAPLGPLMAPGAQIGRVKLSDLLDRHRDMLVRQLGDWTWGIGAAGDPGFKNFFLTFLKPDLFVIAPLGDLNRLRGEGINITIAPGTTYNFRVAINIFDPVRGSTLKITPVSGTRGPKHDVKTGVVLDAVKAKSYVFKTGGKEFWLLHGTDVDPQTNTLAKTKSFLFINEAGMNTQAWALAESALAIGKPTAVDLGGTSVILIRSEQGELSLHNPN